MLKFVTAALAALALSSFASAQSCSDLSISGSGASGGTVTVGVSGAPVNAPTFLFIGQQTGSTSIAVGPFGTLDLGLAAPFGVFAFGSTDLTGNLSLSVQIPNVPIPQPVTVFLQATSLGIRINRNGPPTVGFCTSDVESLTLG
ncbi:MAG: hypothetical protein IPN34_23625 [Planctomycetes bacterium]|nr:hypothetical protein [Planctomycetota bacterium]